MIDIGMGAWVSDYDGYMLMKFTSKYEFQQDFLNGKLFFNTADWFANCEDEGRGDSDEGNTFLINYNNPGLVSAKMEMIDGQAMIVVRDYSNNPENFEEGTVWSYSSADNRFRKIISFYTVYLNLQKRIVGEFPDNMAKEFGEYGVLILDRKEFFSRVADAFKKMTNCKDAKMGFVEYHKTNEGLNDWHPFRKDVDRFAYQNEFRITYVDDTKECFKLDLGKSLRDIAVPIMANDVGEIYFEGDNLLYPTYKEKWYSKLLRRIKAIF